MLSRSLPPLSHPVLHLLDQLRQGLLHRRGHRPADGEGVGHLHGENGNLLRKLQLQPPGQGEQLGQTGEVGGGSEYRRKVRRAQPGDSARCVAAGTDGVDDNGLPVADQQLKQGQAGEGTIDDVGLVANQPGKFPRRQDADGVVREQVVAQPEDQGAFGCFCCHGLVFAILVLG